MLRLNSGPLQKSSCSQNIFVTRKFAYEYSFSIFLKGILKWQGVGVWVTHQSNRYDFAYNRRCFLDILEGLLSCFESQKTGCNVKGQKRGHLFWGGFRYQKVSTQDINRATAHVPIRHLHPRHLYPQGAYLEQDFIQAIWELLPPDAISGMFPVSSDEKAAGGCRSMPICPVPFLTHVSTSTNSVSVSPLKPPPPLFWS